MRKESSLSAWFNVLKKLFQPLLIHFPETKKGNPIEISMVNAQLESGYCNTN